MIGVGLAVAPGNAATQIGDSPCRYRHEPPFRRLPWINFDLADRAYQSAIQLTGETTQILNNQGYSFMLRGDLVTARKKFLQAYRREPNNPTIANNLKLLDSSSRSIDRGPDPRGTSPE